jgi:hypothetical protein
MGGLVVEQLYLATVGKITDAGDGNHLAGFKTVEHFDEGARTAADLDSPAHDG